MKCPYCKNEEFVTVRAKIYTTTRYYCMACGCDFDVNRTNADRIRAMSDEELARFISLDDEHAYGGILGWLKQEVE